MKGLNQKDMGLNVSALATLRRIETQHRHQHSYLEPSDECWVIADYRAGNCGASEIRQLIFNWKCAPSTARRNPEHRRAKEAAVSTVASILRRCCDRQWAENATWCPIPTSKVIGSRDYDDRLRRTVRTAFAGYDLDVRMLLRQTVSTSPDHIASTRSTSEHLYNVLQVDVRALERQSPRQRIVLFDDLLTSGKHFKCCQRRLREVAPEVPISGLFFARRVQSSRWCNVDVRSDR